MDELPLLGRFCLPVFFLYMMCISIKSLTVYFPLDLSSSLFLFKLFIYLTLLGLSYGTLDLQSSLQHAGSLVVACRLLAVACGIQFPDQGLNLGPLHWECGILATGQSGKSWIFHFNPGNIPGQAGSTLTTVDAFKPVTSPCWLWNFDSHRRIIIFLFQKRYHHYINSLLYKK